MIKVKSKLRQAYSFAKKVHDGQFRNDGKTPYFTHPLKVYNTLKEFTNDKDVLIAALLHDSVEDTDTKIEDIEVHFGKRIAELVREVTKDKNGNFDIKTKEGLMIKLAYTLHNVSTQPSLKYFQKKKEWFENIRREFL